MTRRRALVAGLVALLLLPLAIAVRVGWHPIAGPDRTADDRAHELVRSNAGLLSAARGVTHLGDPLVVTVLAVVAAIVCWLLGRRRDAVYVAAVRVGAVVLGFVLKEAVARTRPSLPQPVAHASGYSFPSGHALGAAALYTSLAVVAAGVLGRRWRPALVALAVVVPLAVATTRVLLGVHFPSDVIAGLVLGWAIALLGRSAKPAEPGEPKP
ncbi:MAG: phosphatase PAP2 family protein [Frankiaceae bacterium]|nr:phosphatase PAP2 family protein [Frankiaceae bacterium]